MMSSSSFKYDPKKKNMPSGNLVKWFATKEGDAYKVGKDKSIYKIEEEVEEDKVKNKALIDMSDGEDTLHNDVYNSMDNEDQSLIDNILTQNYKQDSFSKAQAALENGQQPLDDADESPEDAEAKSAAEAEALEIFNRLQREAAEDEAKKAAEIAQARFEAAEKFEPAEGLNPDA